MASVINLDLWAFGLADFVDKLILIFYLHSSACCSLAVLKNTVS